MTLQTQDLVMVGLGVKDDVPPNQYQPILRNGVHLRWVFNKSLGFPWYGFTLFRRLHNKGGDICVTGGTQISSAGIMGQTTLPTPEGVFSSDTPISFTDEFPLPGVYEFDLANRSYLRFTLNSVYTSHSAQTTIGFHQLRQPQCINFSDEQASSGSGALVLSNTTFVVRKKGLVIDWLIEQTSTAAGTLLGLNCGYSLEIDLPYPSQQVELRLTRLTDQPATADIFNHDGIKLQEQAMHNAARQPESISFSGRDITRVVVTCPTNEVMLHEICFIENSRHDDMNQVTVKAYLGDLEVASTIVSGAPGAIVRAAFEFDAITAIECSSANASLIEVCFSPISRDARQGWQVCPGFPAPLGLPITHPDYPCTGNAPVNEPAANTLAMSRISYGSTSQWTTSFVDLHYELLDLVVGGPFSTPMAQRTLAATAGTADPPDPDAWTPVLPTRYLLDMVMLSSLHPAMAQMLGLYWVDATAVPEVAYDYLIVANYYGYSNNLPNDLLAGLFSNIYGIYGYITYNLVLSTPSPLPPPTDLRCYALEGATRNVQGGGLDDGTNSVGLRWDLNKTSPGILAPGHAIMFHIWRADLENNETPSPVGMYNILTKNQPVLATDPVLPAGVTVQYPNNWPPFSLYYMNSGLPDGWYGYQASGIDVFGRHSVNSNSATWYEWTPPPDPQPWYYISPAGDTVVNASAVRLLSKLPPPPPSGVEAYALDPLDTTLVRDAAYQSWFTALSPTEQTSLIGLRVRWVWTSQAMRQAPNTKEFRIYYQDGRPNAVSGRITSVSADNDTQSAVMTDIINMENLDAYAGATLWIGASAYSIIGSDATSPLVLYVTNLGRTYATGMVAVTNGSAKVSGIGTAWDAGLIGLSFQVEGLNRVYNILNVASPTSLTVSVVYAETTSVGTTYQIFQKRPLTNSGCTIVIPSIYSVGTVTMTASSTAVTGDGTQKWNSSFVGQIFRVQNDLTRYRVVAVTSESQLTLDQPYLGPSSGPGFVYTIGFSLFRDLSNETNWDKRYYIVDYDSNITATLDPIYSVGTVTMTAGSTAVTGDGTQKWNSSFVGQIFRVQNDPKKYRITDVPAGTKIMLDEPYSGPVSSSGLAYTIGMDARVYEVFIPGADDSSRAGLPLFTSLAKPIVYSQIGVSAADDRTHTYDDPKWNASSLGNRTGNEGKVGGPATIFRIRRDLPPAPIPPPDSERVFATPADYLSHSYYTYRWQPQPNLKTHIFRAVDDFVFRTDWRNQPRTNIDALNPALFPDDPHWDLPKRQEVANELNQLNAFLHDGAGTSTAFAFYSGLSNDGLRVLAGLPGNEKAFTQLTTVALDPDDPANANRIGPDNQPNFIVDPSLRAYLDTIDGRSTNRYFYRCRFIDTAHNQGPLGLSSPPVWLPQVISPRIPVITKVLGGELKIEVRWASNRESDLAQYNVYRADKEETARDLRLMTQVHTEVVPLGDPSTRPAEIIWTDGNVIGLQTYFYRIVSVDSIGNTSSPCAAAAARAHDEALPVVPQLNVVWEAASPPQHAIATWNSTDDTLLERLATTMIWQPVGDWNDPGNYNQTLDIDHGYDWRFRLRIRKYTGAVVIGPVVELDHV